MRRMIPTKLIDWIKGLSSKVKQVGNETQVSGDLAVSGAINGEENPSVKPIYCHPIRIIFNRTSDSKLFYITCLIFNNSATPFTKQTFYDWCVQLFTDFSNSTIMASGFVGTAPISCIKESSDVSISLHVVSANTNSESENWTLGKAEILLATTQFYDGVNKIN